MTPIRILLLADTHLGFDQPAHPRIARRRRGPDFFNTYRLALQPALERQVDLVVHGGDLLYRSRVPPSLVDQALAPLLEVARLGIPVFLFPGNHERSRIPLQLWNTHPNLNIFHQPATFLLDVRGLRLAVSGFPFAPRIRDRFPALLLQTGYPETTADLRLLCLHQAVEGARVGPSDFTFRSGPDVIPGRDLPVGFTAFLCGHIHRSQVLNRDLSGRPFPAPVLYPGSTERTAFAERFEEKGYLLVTVDPRLPPSAWVKNEFIKLPARPMHLLHLTPADLEGASLPAALASRLSTLPPDSVVSLRLDGPQSWLAEKIITNSFLRDLAPPTMNITLSRSYQQLP